MSICTSLTLIVWSLIMSSFAFQLSRLVISRRSPLISCTRVPFLSRGSMLRHFSAVNEGVSETVHEIQQARLDKIADMRKNGINPFAYSFNVSHKVDFLQNAYKNLQNGEVDNSVAVSLSGRIMLKRVFGKLAFFTIVDETGSIQLYLEKNVLGDEFQRIKDWTDAGDIIGVHGHLKRTDKGELSIVVNKWEMLTKSLRPLPDKYHGIMDINKRYRHRHLDFMTNSEARNRLVIRAKAIQSIRRWMDNKGFLEMETPVLQDQPGGAEARPFETYHYSLNMTLTLRIATELHLKRLLVGGFPRVYEIGRIFRNEGISSRHNPEFTSIELYQANADYQDMMTLAETMLRETAQEVLGTLTIPYQSHTLDLATPWKRISMVDCVKEMTGVDFGPDLISGSTNDANAKAAELKISRDMLESCSTVGEILNVVFEERCEANLIQPTFVTDYPVEISPLAKPHRSIPGLVERFELFMVGRELANAFSELTDPVDQRVRFELQALKKEAGDVEACGVDEPFLEALESGMPPAGGMGIGIDRWVMVLSNAPSIRDVIAFPLLRKE